MHNKVKHVSDFMVDVWSGREWCIANICKGLEEKLNKEKATVIGSPQIVTYGTRDDLLYIVIPYLPNSNSGHIAVKYSFTPCNYVFDSALKKFSVEEIISDYPVSIQIIAHDNSNYRHILAMWTETTKTNALTHEEIKMFRKSAKSNNKFAK